jgi:hypothetical protein
VLRLALQAEEPQGADDVLASLHFVDGLVGSGQPVPNIAGVDGNSRPPCNRDSALLTIRFQAGSGNQFMRGNANGDSAVNLADAIWSFRALFLTPGESPCRDAEDANDDGAVNIADPLLLLNYQLLGGAIPPEPYPGCGEDPDGDDDGLDCAVSQPACAGP